MQHLIDLKSWAEMDPGVDYAFHKRARPMTVEVNTSKPVPLFIHFEGEDSPRLLALVNGRDTLKFVVPDIAFTIGHVEADAHVYLLTGDGELHHRQEMGQEKFTTLYEGRRLSPEMQEVYERLNRNAERNTRALLREIDALAAERDRYAGALTSSVVSPEPANVAVPPANESVVPPSSRQVGGGDADESSGG